MVSTIRTEQGALCAMLFGTLPRTLLAPRMPLLPTTTRSAPICVATRTMASAGSPVAAWISASTPALFATEMSFREQRVGRTEVVRGEEFGGQVGGAKRLRFVGGDDVQLGAARLGEVHGRLDGAQRGRRAVCANQKLLEHLTPPPLGRPGRVFPQSYRRSQVAPMGTRARGCRHMNTTGAPWCGRTR